MDRANDTPNLQALLSKYRSALMGIAALIIVILHAHWDSPFVLFRAIENFGNMGVDIFAFLAGFGLSHSLGKKDYTFEGYYKKRLNRLLPDYYVALVPALFICGASLKRIIATVLCIDKWLDVSIFWYVGASLFWYAILPPIYFAIKKARYPRIAAAAFMLLFVFPLSYLFDASSMVTRFPAVILGCALGTCYKRENAQKAARRDYILLAAVTAYGLALVLNNSFLTFESPYSPNLLKRNLCAPFVTVMLACLLKLFDRLKLKPIIKLFEAFGKYSLQVYLSHFLIREFYLQTLGLTDRLVLLVIMLVLSLPLAMGIAYLGNRLRALTSFIMKRISIKSEVGDTI